MTRSAIFEVPPDMQERGAEMFENTLLGCKNSRNYNSQLNVFKMLVSPYDGSPGCTYHFSETVDEYLRASQKALQKAEEGDIRESSSTVAMIWALVHDTNLITQSVLYV
jgi:hypothetical protein